MKPYTTVNKACNDEDLRINWRENNRVHRKNKDRAYKKIYRRKNKKIDLE